MTQHFLNMPDVCSVAEQVGGAAVAEGVSGYPFVQFAAAVVFAYDLIEGSQR